MNDTLLAMIAILVGLSSLVINAVVFALLVCNFNRYASGKDTKDNKPLSAFEIFIACMMYIVPLLVYIFGINSQLVNIRDIGVTGMIVSAGTIVLSFMAWRQRRTK